MLSPTHEEEDEEDSHLCIKCNTTIIGLNNYIKHRKTLCPKLKYGIVRKTNTSKNDDSVEIPSFDSIDTNLGADLFFQSLELQSSSKKPAVHAQRLTPPICAKESNSETTRRTSIITSEASSSAASRISPVETKHRGTDWIGGHSLRFSNNADNETKLINAVASISGHAKKDVPATTYNLYEDDSHDESDDFDDIEDEEQHAGAKWKPPPNHTGGKWKPDSREPLQWSNHQLTGVDIDEWDLREENTNKLDEEGEEDYDAPPPGHTKGKWVPGAKDIKQEPKSQIMQNTIQAKGSVQYWCGPCNRKLASRAIYEKHLLTNLHLKKICLENDLEYSGHIELPIEFEKRTSRPSQYVDGTVYSQFDKLKPCDSNELTKKKKRKRKNMFTACPGCRSRVKCTLMGKHLISHFHFRRTTVSGETYSELIMEHMEKIVRQSPFQCSPCKFYANREINFIQHWLSESHKCKCDSIDGRYWCSFCKVEFDDSDVMLQHLTSNEHGEVIAAINRSMPIVIRKKSVFQCEECFQEFRYNIELKYHSRVTGHTLSTSATENYQETEKCPKCGLTFKTTIALASHLKRIHKEKGFVCLVCSITFQDALTSIRHRNSAPHRIKRAEKLKEKGMAVPDLKRKCSYCDEILDNTMELKKHMDLIHPEFKPRCAKCGEAFALPQQVSQHVRRNACKIPAAETSSGQKWHCSQCVFTTDSSAECYYHEVLHNPPFQYVFNVLGVEKSVLKYRCPLCEKLFKKTSLRSHLRQHTSEKPFRCSYKDCKAEFSRWSSAVNHQKTSHNNSKGESATKTGVEKRCPCSVCGSSFSSNSKLKRHMMVHETGGWRTCNHPGCNFKGRTHGELKTHTILMHDQDKQFACPIVGCKYASKTLRHLRRHNFRVHTDGREMKHSCNHCSYKTDQASHLKIHQRKHEGTKPYNCPYCQFTSASLENLRKHILKLATHSGLPLYECKECPQDAIERYVTNLASEFRGHLVDCHDEKFDRKSAIKYVSEFFFVKQNT